jgi:hypothetical protein
MSYQVHCTTLLTASQLIMQSIFQFWTTYFCIIIIDMYASHTDLATQMRYLTDVSSSQRNSKVISWISESGEIEGTGQLYTSAREMSERDGCKTIKY